MSFWLGIVAMTVLGLGVLLWPLLRNRTHADQRGEITDQLRRLDELNDDVAAGDIDQTVAQELKTELERAVYDATRAPGVESSVAPARSTRLGFALAVLVPTVALLVYLQLGTPQLASYLADLGHPDLSDVDVSVEFMLSEVRDRLAAEPNDIAGWWILARTELQRGRFTEAIAAVERVLEIAPDQNGAKLLLIDALVMRDDGRLNDRAQKLVDQLLADEPQNPSALIMKGMSLQQNGELEMAADAWRQALPQLEADSPLRPQVQTMLAAIGAPVSDTVTAVTVAISVRESSIVDLPPDTPVFVFARVPDQAGPPVAATRLRLDQLPLTVTLTDDMAMAPGHTLSSAGSVYVVARVAVSGQPTGGPNDIEARTPDFEVAHMPATLTIELGAGASETD